MSLEPLLSAGPLVASHAFAAMAAFVIGVVQLLAPKGTVPHRALGYAWALLMGAVVITSLFIQHLATAGFPNLWGFSPVHLLTLWTAYSLPIAVHAARRRDLATHKRHMTGLFLGALVIAGAFTFLPGRIMHAVLFGG